jgi:hypothetical protein
MESHGQCGGGRVGVGLALAIAIAALSISGCGGGGGSSATGETTAKTTPVTHEQPLTRAVLISRADAVCLWSQRALRRAAVKNYKDTRFENPTERLPWVPYSRTVLAIAEKTVRQLKELVPPPQLRSAFEAYVGTEEEGEDLAKQAMAAAREDDDGPYYKARKTRDAGALERFELASKVGLKKCGPDPFGRAKARVS